MSKEAAHPRYVDLDGHTLSIHIKLISTFQARGLHRYFNYYFQGYIPLHLASFRGHVGVVGLLLSRSTSLLKISDAKGQTCLHVAAANGHYEMVQALLGQGSDQTMVDKVIMLKNFKYYSSF